jgi:VWFA-related protein
MILSLALLAPLTAAAQDSPQPTSTFTSNSELVLVPVQVMRGGQPLPGLGKEDFTLESDGKVQHLAAFEEFRRSTQVFWPGAEVKMPIRESTNFSNFPAEGMPHEVMVIVVDTVNVGSYLQKWTKKQLIAYFQSHRLLESTSLVEMTQGGMLEFQPPTWDANELVSALKKMQPTVDQFRPELTTGLHASLHGGPGEYAMAMANIQQARYQELLDSLGATGQSLRCFEQIARAYSAIPGRKTVVWFTTGFDALNQVPDPPPLFGKPGPDQIVPVTSLHHMGKDLVPEFRQTLTTLNQANVVLYPVDVAAFREDHVWWTAWGGCSGSVASFGMARGLCADDFNDGWEHIGMKVLARSTGGEPCDAGNHVQHCIDFAWGESNGYYLLCFYVSRESRKVGWHDLTVHVRAEHDEVRARSGYYLEAQGPPPKSEEKRSLDDTIVAAVEYTGIPLTVEPGKRAGEVVPFKVSVPAKAITLLRGETTLSFDVVTVPISDRGRPIENGARISNVNINASGTKKALENGWQLIDFASSPRSAVAVKVVVRDNNTGGIGSVVFPLGGDSGSRSWAVPKQGAVVLLDGAKAN